MTRWNPSRLPRYGLRSYERIWRASPPTILAGGFLFLILLGTLLLKLPICLQQPVGWQEALFTATSAVTVTGLVTVDVGGHFTLWGELVLMLLIQAGGLGLMTFSVVTLLMLGHRISLRHELVAREAINQTSLSSVKKTSMAVLRMALTLEAVGFVLLAIFWIPDMGWSKGSWWALFHSISAFNNAGFGLSANSLMDYSGSFGINLVISALYVLGGLGFAVMVSLISYREQGHLPINTRLVLYTTVGLNVAAMVLILLLESDNPATLEGMDGWGEQLWAAWFQATTPRTAGFNTVDIGALNHSTCMILILLMFIGAGSNSTGSGIKINTFVVLLSATWSFIRRYQAPTLFGRGIPSETVLKALAVSVMAMMVVFLGIFMLTVTEKADYLDVVFEVVSAFGTVGLSRGLTPELSTLSQWVLMVVMFVGRLGPLTLAFLLATPRRSMIRHAEAEIQIG
ncbi:TrkH family potassium uptake protein [Marinobacteraceae bacterium S3BR75-40.1]